MTTSTDILRSACSAQTVIATPLGRLLLARTPRGLAGAWFEGQRHHPPQLDAPDVSNDPLLNRVADQLERYFAGSLHAFDIPFDLQGTDFQRAVWKALLAIDVGTTRSYSDIAREIGKPVAVRAVGAAVGRNPVSILVPCHRVIGSDGALTGYAGGIDRKVALLRIESVRLAPTALRLRRAIH